MSLKFSVALLKNPLRREEPSKYYAKSQVRSVIGLNRVAKTLARQSTVTEGDAYNVLVNLPHVLNEFMADGDMVDLGDFGKFQYQLSSKGTEERSEFTHANIKKVKIHFRPSKLLQKHVSEMEFEEVVPLKDKKETKKQVKQR